MLMKDRSNLEISLTILDAIKRGHTHYKEIKYQSQTNEFMFNSLINTLVDGKFIHTSNKDSNLAEMFTLSKHGYEIIDLFSKIVEKSDSKLYN